MKNLLLKETKLGKWVFANKNFVKWEKIIDFQGAILEYSELPNPYEEVEDHYLQIDKKLYMWPSGKLDDFLNHSCNPNSGLKFVNKRIILFAIKNIKKRSQIAWDYSTTMDEDERELDCQCGSKNCRKKVKDFKYLPEKIQKKYINLWIVPGYIFKKYFFIF